MGLLNKPCGADTPVRETTPGAQDLTSGTASIGVIPKPREVHLYFEGRHSEARRSSAGREPALNERSESKEPALSERSESKGSADRFPFELSS
jgi:hypothetical protein